MIAPEDIRRQAERAYPRFLSSLVTGESFFPLDIRFGKQFMKGHYHEFADARAVLVDGAVRLLGAPIDNGTGSAGGARTRKSAGYILELEEHNSRRFGTQAVPARIYFDDPREYAGFLGRRDEVERFRAAVDATRECVPELLPWLGRRPASALPHLDEWSELLEIVRYFLDHPRPKLYVRELPLSVHTKFVEEHEGILRQLLDELLPEAAVDVSSTRFEQRFGLRYDEPTVRLRRLDPAVEPGWPADDLSMPVSALAELDPAAERVVISENKMTFLTLPAVAGGLGLWGGGLGIDVLKSVPWLPHRSVYYWGDLDAHGFLILSRLRSFVPGARSVMMDVKTFDAFREFAVEGAAFEDEMLPNLTPSEQAVFRSLARLRLRLEQERIAQEYVRDRFAEIFP